MASINQVQVNNITYDINDKDTVRLYKQEDNTSLYTDSSFTTELTVGSFQTLLVNGGKKKLWIVGNNAGSSPALYIYGDDGQGGIDSAGIRFFGLEGVAELLTFVALDTSDPDNTFTCTSTPLGEDVFDFMYEISNEGGQSSTKGSLIVTGPTSIMINDAVADAIASGDQSEIQQAWIQLLALMTGAMDQTEGLGHKKFTLINMESGDSGVEVRGTNAYVAVSMKLFFDYQTQELGQLQYSVVSEPYYNTTDQKWQTASFALSQNQTLVDKLQFDVTISDFSAGGGAIELYAEPADSQTYPDLDGYYVLNPAVSMQAIKDAMDDGSIVRLNFTDPNSNEWTHLDLIDFNLGGTTQMFYTSPYQVSPGGNFITAVIVPNDISYTQVFESIVEFAFPTVSYASTAGSASSSTYTGRADTLASKVWYGTCTTAADTTAKVVTVQRSTGYYSFSLTKGAIIFVDFTYANTAAVANLTLNVGGTGAVAIKCASASSGGMTLSANLVNVGQIVLGVNTFMYDGTYWVLIGTNSDYMTYQQNTTTSNAYRVLLSGSANNTSDTTTTRKSGNLTFNPSSGALNVTGTLAVTQEITSFGNQVLTNGDGLLWSDNSGEDAEMLADNLSMSGYSSVSINTSANQDGELSISSDYITLTSPQYGGEIGLDDTGVYISNSSLPIRLNGYDIEIFAGGGSGITIDGGDTITVTSYADVDFNVDGNLNYNGNLIATQNWVTNQVIGAIGGSY